MACVLSLVIRASQVARLLWAVLEAERTVWLICFSDLGISPEAARALVELITRIQVTAALWRQGVATWLIGRADKLVALKVRLR